MVDLIFDDDGLDCRQDRDFRPRQAERVREVDGILDDVDLVFERRIDVDGGVGDEQRPRIVRSVDDEDVAHAPRGAQLFLVDDRAHEFVGMEAAFHQRLDLVVARQRDGLRRGGVAVLGRHKFVGGEVEFGRRRSRADFCLGSDQHRDDELFLGGFDGAEQRDRIHRMDDSSADRRQPARFLDEVLVVSTLHLETPVRTSGSQFTERQSAAAAKGSQAFARHCQATLG